jgi:hypothetical protein
VPKVTDLLHQRNQEASRRPTTFPKEMEAHLPNDKGSGEWQLAVIPFSALA